MTQPPATGSLTRDQVLDQLEMLATVEHALIVENLSICCAMGHDLDPDRGGGTSPQGRDAAGLAYSRAQTEMFHFADVNAALIAAGRDPHADRAPSVTDATGADVSLDPPTADQLQHLLQREQTIAAAVDAHYALLQQAVTPDDALRSVIDAGTTHTSAYTDLRDALGDPLPPDVLRATRRDTEDPSELRTLAVADRVYREIVAALRLGWGQQDVFVGGTITRIGIELMSALDDTNRLLVERGLLPAFNP